MFDKRYPMYYIPPRFQKFCDLLVLLLKYLGGTACDLEWQDRGPDYPSSFIDFKLLKAYHHGTRKNLKSMSE